MKLRQLRCLESSGTIYTVTRRHIPKEQARHLHRCDSLLELGIQSLDIYEMLCDQQGNSTHEKANFGDFHIYGALYITGSVSCLSYTT
jgi:hypothetical protein